MNLKSQIPNIFTLSNLLSGMASVFLTTQHELEWASLCILIGAFFDLLDGLIARALGVAGELGKQLDSLADMVTFGVAPAFLAMHMAGAFDENIGFSIMGFAPAIMAAFSAYRLGKFNLDTRQSDSFIGVPTPANALFWLSFPLILAYSDTSSGLGSIFLSFTQTGWMILAGSIVWSLLMVSEIPMIALKFKNWGWKGNEFRYSLIASVVILVALLWVQAVPIILLLYILLSIVESIIKK